MRIGDVARRTGVSPATLRAWQRRYGALQPTRTQGGHRVYTDEDVARVQRLTALVDAGARVSQAARQVAEGGRVIGAASAEVVRRRLWGAIDAFDDGSTRVALGEATGLLGIPGALDRVLVPVLRRLGSEGRAGPRSRARVQFASVLVRAHLAHLLPVARTAPMCLAFCPEGEGHDIGLAMAALTVATAGRQPVVLGADTPSASIEVLVRELRPSVVLIGAATRQPVLRLLEWWRPPDGCTTLAGGPGFRPQDGSRLGGRVHLGAYADLLAQLT